MRKPADLPMRTRIMYTVTVARATAKRPGGPAGASGLLLYARGQFLDDGVVIGAEGRG